MAPYVTSAKAETEAPRNPAAARAEKHPVIIIAIMIMRYYYDYYH